MYETGEVSDIIKSVHNLGTVHSAQEMRLRMKVDDDQ
jgi:hypothetical protein